MCRNTRRAPTLAKVSAGMLRDFGVRFRGRPLGRRQYHGRKTDADVAAKAQRCWRRALRLSCCVEQTLAQREAGETEAVVGPLIGGW